MNSCAFTLNETAEYMSVEQQEYFNQVLLKKKSEVIDLLESNVNSRLKETSAKPDPLDLAGQQEEINLSLETESHSRKVLQKINGALLLIKNDEYGFCEQCGIEIGLKRLLITPEASSCVDCQHISEIRNRQLGAA